MSVLLLQRTLEIKVLPSDIGVGPWGVAEDSVIAQPLALRHAPMQVMSVPVGRPAECRPGRRSGT